jgi:hypothetical protein
MSLSQIKKNLGIPKLGNRVMTVTERLSDNRVRVYEKTAGYLTVSGSFDIGTQLIVSIGGNAKPRAVGASAGSFDV